MSSKVRDALSRIQRRRVEAGRPRRLRRIVLKSGVTQDAQLWNWRKAIEQGTADRRNGSIILVDDARTPILRRHFSNSWVSKFTGPDLNAEANDVAIETIEIAHEGLTLDT